MLYIVDGEEYKKKSASQIADEIGLDPYVKKMLQTKAIFRQKPSRLKKDRSNPSLKRPNYMTTMPASFSYSDKNGMVKYLHYSESDVPDRKTGKPTLQPRSVNFKGSSFQVVDNFDKALFFYLHPFNINSPFSKDTKASKNMAIYSFVNKRQDAKDSMANLNALEMALEAYKNLSSAERKYITRGLGLMKSIDSVEQEEIDFALKQYAASNSKNFLITVEMNKSVHLKGRILNLLDQGYFTVKNIGNTRQWIVTRGRMEGTQVGDQMLSRHQDAEDHLVNSIIDDLDTYSDLIKEVYSSQADNSGLNEKIELSGILEDLGEMDIPEPEKVQDLQLPNIDDRQSVSGFLKSFGVSASAPNVNSMISLMKTGQVNSDNVRDYLKKLKQPKEK